MVEVKIKGSIVYIVNRIEEYEIWNYEVVNCFFVYNSFLLGFWY